MVVVIVLSNLGATKLKDFLYLFDSGIGYKLIYLK